MSLTHLELSLKSDPETFNSHKTRVLLIALNLPGYYSLPVRILSLLAGNTEAISKKFDTRFIELDVVDNLNDLSKTVYSWRPAIIGLTVNIWNRNKCFKLAKLLKARLPKTVIIAGGQEVTRSVIDYLEIIPEFDYIIDGEGEIPFRQFLENWDTNKKKLRKPDLVSGLRYRDNGKIKHTGPAQLVESLDEIPSTITYGLVPFDRKQKLGVLLEGSRCCPFRCSFCFEGAKRGRVRTVTVARLIREIEYMADRGAAYFHIMDPILCYQKPQRLKVLTDFIKELTKVKKIIFSVEAYAENITDEVADCLSACSIIDIGLQTINPVTIKAIHRKYDTEKFRKGLDRLRQTSASFNLYLICGLPYETMITYFRGIQFVINEKPTHIFFNELCLLNGTELREKANEYCYRFDSDPPYTVYETKWMSSDDLKLARAASKMIEKQYNLSTPGIYNKLPWLGNIYPNGRKHSVRLKGKCSLHCKGCLVYEGNSTSFEEKSELDLICGCDVEIQIGDNVEKDYLFQIAGQLQLAGAARVKLVAPSQTLLELDFVKHLINRGIWHFKTFVGNSIAHPFASSDINIDNMPYVLKALRNLNRSFALKGKAAVHPFVEVVVFSNGLNLDELIKQIDELIFHNVTVITVPATTLNSSKDWIEEMADLFKRAVTHRTWLKMPEEIARCSLKAMEDLDEIIRHFTELDLISKESCLPPCYQGEGARNKAEGRREEKDRGDKQQTKNFRSDTN